MSETPKFQEVVSFENCPELDKSLAIQVAEALLYQDMLCDKKGLRTQLRIACQGKTVDERIQLFYRTIEPIWQAVNKPGAYSLNKIENKKWLDGTKNAAITAIFAACGNVGIDEIVVKGKTLIANLTNLNEKN